MTKYIMNFKNVPDSAKEELEDESIFRQHFIDFNNINKNALDKFVHISFYKIDDDLSNVDLLNMINLKDTRLTGEMSKWCKENKIKYKKVKVDNIRITSPTGKSLNWGRIQYGLYFPKMEDATAFKLKWC